MNVKNVRWLCAGLSLLGCQAAASAQVYAVLQYESFFSQTGSPLPAAPYSTFVYTSLRTDCAAEDIETTMTNPSLFQFALEQEGDADPNGDRRFSAFFGGTTENELFGDNPSGQYLYETFTPTDPFCEDTNTFNQPFPAGGGGWPSATPHFSAPTFSLLQAFDPAVSNVLTFNTFTPFAGSTYVHTFVYVLDENNAFAFDSTLSSSTGTVTIPAGSLQPGTDYSIQLRFYSQRDQTVDFHSHALSFARTTIVEFTTMGTAGCVADVGGQGGVQGGDGTLDNNDFIVFIDFFFAADPRADLGSQGGVAGSDGAFDNNDFVVFIDRFFVGC